MTGDGRGAKGELFWQLAREHMADPAVTRSAMMDLPCLRLNGAFFASLDPKTGDLIIKLPAARVGELIQARNGVVFAPSNRVFREWVANPETRLRGLRRLAAGGEGIRRRSRMKERGQRDIPAILHHRHDPPGHPRHSLMLLKPPRRIQLHRAVVRVMTGTKAGLIHCRRVACRPGTRRTS